MRRLIDRDWFKSSLYGQHHQVAHDRSQAVCGRPVPVDAELTTVESNKCARCKGEDYTAKRRNDALRPGEYVNRIRKAQTGRIPVSPMEKMEHLNFLALVERVRKELGGEIVA